MRMAPILDTLLLVNLVLALGAMLLLGAIFAGMTGDASASLFGPLLVLAEAREGNGFCLWIVSSHVVSLAWWIFRKVQASSKPTARG